MRRTIAFLSVVAVFLFILGCSKARLSEEEYSRRATDAYRQGKYEEAWTNYRMLLSYYPESPKAEQYRSQLVEVLLKLAQNSPEQLKQGYFDELKMLGASSDTLMAWLKFSAASNYKDKEKSRQSFKEITFKEYLLAAQYAINRMRFRDALHAYDKCAQIYPDNPGTYKALFLAGFVASEYLKDKDSAREYYKKVIEKYPDCDLADDAKWMLENMDKPPDQITFTTDTTKNKGK
ncbi:tetratricopeptide repeat protein [bacterium]|nr:tetratricopeptide repeat protein [bacterium]